MDFLDITIRFACEQEGFKFHVQVQRHEALSPLLEDLLLFCHGDFRSIYTLLQGFQMFLNASGLEVNK